LRPGFVRLSLSEAAVRLSSPFVLALLVPFADDAAEASAASSFCAPCVAAFVPCCIPPPEFEPMAKAMHMLAARNASKTTMSTASTRRNPLFAAFCSSRRTSW
jgi:hypothetical protein